MKMGFLAEILSNLRGVVDAVPTPQKKHLLHLLVKKVLIRNRNEIEVWYRLPQFPEVRTLSNVVAPTSQYAKHSRFAPLSAPRQAIFCVSTSSRDSKGSLKDFRLRMAG